jgi:hypothetical protein
MRTDDPPPLPPVSDGAVVKFRARSSEIAPFDPYLAPNACGELLRFLFDESGRARPGRFPEDGEVDREMLESAERLIALRKLRRRLEGRS